MKNDKHTIKVFASHLRLLLKHHSLSLRKLAKITGLAHAYIFKLTKEQRLNPSMDVVEKIAKAFKIKVSHLLGEQEIDFKNRPKELDFDEEE